MTLLSSISNSFDIGGATGVTGIVSLLILLLTSGLFGAVDAGISADFATNWADAMKDYYTDGKPAEMIYGDHPFLQSLRKIKKFPGKQMPIELIFGDPTGISTGFATAKANRTPSDIAQFMLPRETMYGFITIDHETMLASADDAGAFIPAKKREFDGMLRQFGRRLSIYSYGNGSGVVGQLHADVNLASDQLQLRIPSDVTNFERKMVICLSAANDGSGAVKAGRLQIVAIDRDLGILTVDDDISTAIPTAAVDDYISFEGDYGNVPLGIQSYVPPEAPDATPFLTVDRTLDITRLSGVRMNLSDMPVSEALNTLLRRCEREGANIDFGYMNHAQFGNLVNELGAKVEYHNVKAGDGAVIGFKGIQVNGKRGVVNIVSDVDCPNDKLILTQSDTWGLRSIGDFGRIWDTDGLPFLRQTDEDGIEARCYGYGNLECNAPGYNGIATLAVVED